MATIARTADAAPALHISARVAQRREAGAAWRQRVPFEAQAEWQAPARRRDPVEVLIDQGKSRIPELLPVRYARMKTDPFAFLRGSAAVMAADLGAMPATGLRVQSCGDCHLANFGGYASPEGTPVFDINDFDETLPAPFEWDVGASRRASSSPAGWAHMAERRLRAPRPALKPCATTAGTWRVWRRCRRSARGARASILPAPSPMSIRRRSAGIWKIGWPRSRASAESPFGGLVEQHAGAWRIWEKPPLVHHLSRHELHAKDAFASYARKFQEDRRVLVQRYHLRDVAFKVVGVGSVGTFCAIGLLISDVGAPLLLQIKEAQASVLAPYAGGSDYANHGQRVVVGQRMLQAATDIFLGWTTAPVDGHYFYIRRLKDSRLADVGTRLEAALPFYAALCGRTLARAHARAGDAVAIAAYLGDGNEFDKAIAAFAVAYANQTERDWHAFLAAIAAGRISAQTTMGNA